MIGESISNVRCEPNYFDLYSYSKWALKYDQDNLRCVDSSGVTRSIPRMGRWVGV